MIHYWRYRNSLSCG